MKEIGVAGVRGMKNTYRFCWGNVSENDKMEGRKEKRETTVTLSHMKI
jgi:hypothetical protein